MENELVGKDCIAKTELEVIIDKLKEQLERFDMSNNSIHIKTEKLSPSDEGKSQEEEPTREGMIGTFDQLLNRFRRSNDHLDYLQDKLNKFI